MKADADRAADLTLNPTADPTTTPTPEQGRVEGVGGPNGQKQGEKVDPTLNPAVDPTLDKRQLERRVLLFRVISAMWEASQWVRGVNYVLEMGREVSPDASQPLAIEVYKVYNAGYEQKDFEKLLADHGIDYKKMVDLTNPTPTAPPIPALTPPQTPPVGGQNLTPDQKSSANPGQNAIGQVNGRVNGQVNGEKGAPKWSGQRRGRGSTQRRS